MKKNLIFAMAATGALALSACAPAPVVRGDGPTVATPSQTAGSCNITNVGWAIGKSADAATLAKIKADSGATVGRVIAPGQSVTMDFIASRVNVHIDGARNIQRLTCG